MTDLDRIEFSMGRIEQLAGCSIITKFRALNIIPYEAIQSYVEISGRRVPIPRHRRSVAAAYLRVWVTIAACISLCFVLESPFLVIIPYAMAFLAGYCWFFFGRLSSSELRKRLAYAMWIQSPIDPAVFEPDWSLPSVDTLRIFLNERAMSLATPEQRMESEPWRIVAQTSTDPEFLIAALTWTRLARRGALEAEQIALDMLHRTIWSKLEPLLLGGQGPRSYLDWQGHVEQVEQRRLTPRIAVILAGVVGVIAMASIPVVSYFMQPRVAIVNATAFDGLTVILDGKPLVTNMPRARYELDAGFYLTRIATGTHELVAKEASGREIERQSFVIESKLHHGLLYAPALADDKCFYQERITYSRTADRKAYDLVQLDRSKSLHTLTMYIDHWFKAAPEEIEMNGQRATIEHFTVRALPCNVKPPSLAPKK